jgi:hypothetical protein
MAEEDLSEALYVRVTKADKAAVDGLAARLPLKSASITRIALRIGLAAIEKDPSAIFTAGRAKKGGR